MCRLSVEMTNLTLLVLSVKKIIIIIEASHFYEVCNVANNHNWDLVILQHPT
jgi:hypothetical protein